MITTTELAKRTRLSVKTLGRWTDQAVLPKPEIGTHPSGRGKVGFWPDWTVDYCLRIIALRKTGSSLQDAAGTAMQERCEAIGQSLEAEARELVYGAKTLKLPSGRQVDLVQLLKARVAQQIESLPFTRAAKRNLIQSLEDCEKLSSAIHSINEGHHIYLVFSRGRVTYRPDYLLPEVMADSDPSPKDFFALALTPHFHAVLINIGMPEMIPRRLFFPARKVWQLDGHYLRELAYHPSGSGDTHFVSGTASKLIGEVKSGGEIEWLPEGKPDAK